MRVEKIVEDRFTVIKLLEEKLDSTISPSLKGEFIMLNTNGVKNLILDLSVVQYTDSSGLSAILTANRLCKNLDGTLVICGLNSHPQKLVKISHLENVLHIVPSLEEARDAIFMFELEHQIQNNESGEHDQAETHNS